LFILCADVLFSLLTQLQADHKIKGIAIATNAPQITHLFFADDSILFCRAKPAEAKYLMDALNEYQRISGQQINMNKSEMTFSPHLQQQIQQEFHSIMPLQVTNSIAKYLWMPTTLKRARSQDFKFIMDKIWGKLKGWKERNLSFAGRSVLISAVIQAIPTYMMRCFLIPKDICSQIERAICNFWWGGKEGQHKIHWKAKNVLFKPKFSGGLGFRDMHLFNLAMLAKQAWRLHVNPTSLLSKCLKAKYYPHSDILQAQMGNRPSFTWRSIHQAIWVLNKGSCWKIGTGNNINIWRDNWLPQQNGYKILTTKANHSPILVSDLILNQPNPTWNVTLIDNTFLPFERDLIKQLPLIQEPMEDQIMWPHTTNGCYNVKSGYNIMKFWQEISSSGSTNTNPQNDIWKKIWTLPTIPRHKSLLWRIINNALPVRSALSRRGIHCPIFCPICYQKEETINHLFMECHKANRIWFGSYLGINFNPTHRSFIDWLIYCLANLKEDELCYIAAIIYGIWFARNKKVFETHDLEDSTIINMATTTIQDYQKAMATMQNKNSNNQNNNNSRNSDNPSIARRYTNNSNHNLNHKWKKPRAGTIKANCDANLKIDGTWGLGAICRNEHGQVVASATWQRSGFNDPATAEAFALYLTMRFAADCCFTSVDFESDSLKVVNSVNSQDSNLRNYFGNLIRGIQLNLARFRRVSIKHIDRKAN
jgi:hypothetical protein